MKKALVVFGTRPEAVKLAPLISAMNASDCVKPVVCVTGQHRSMLDSVNTLFGVVPDFDLEVITRRQSLGEVTMRTLSRLAPVVRATAPDAVIVQGDTTSAFAAALCAFYHQVPVVHVEAGLRTADKYSPFPEEINRRLVSQLATLHLAPTPGNRTNLIREGIDPGSIVVTGNTGIDALKMTATRAARCPSTSVPRFGDRSRDVVLVTAHRRESWGEPLKAIARAVARLARAHPGALVVWPLHKNPVVRETVEPLLSDIANVCLTEPLGYSEFAGLMAWSKLILTDSGGIQEEAPSLGKPVLVLRDKTERLEAVRAGCAKLVGVDEERVFAEASALLTDRAAYAGMTSTENPYGDGRASARCVAAVAHMLGVAERPEEFDATRASRAGISGSLGPHCRSVDAAAGLSSKTRAAVS